MRTWILLIAAMLVAGQAGAKTIDWHGTIEIDLGVNPSIFLGGSGVATINDSSGGNHLSTLRPGISARRSCASRCSAMRPPRTACRSRF